MNQKRKNLHFLSVSFSIEHNHNIFLLAALALLFEEDASYYILKSDTQISRQARKQTYLKVKSPQSCFCLGGRRIATDAVCVMRCDAFLSLIALHAHIALCSLSFTSRLF